MRSSSRRWGGNWVHSPESLVRQDEFKAFYCSEINAIRGYDVVARMALGLKRSHGATPYKALLMGHSGVGKSTEMTRLTNQIQDKYRAIRFSVAESLDPISFQPFDVLLLMIMKIVELTTAPIEKGGAGQRPLDTTLSEIYNWFATVTEKKIDTVQTGVEMIGGTGATADSWWAKAMGLFASIKGELNLTLLF